MAQYSLLIDIATRGSSQANSAINRLNSSIRSAIGSVTALAASYLSLKQAQKAIDSAVSFDRLRASLQAVTGSAEQASNYISQIKDIVNETGSLDLSTAVGSFTSFLRQGFSTDEALQFNRILANTALFFGASSDSVQRAVVQMEQLAGKTTGFTQDLRAISNAFPDVMQRVTQAFGVNSVEEIQRLGVTGREVVAVMMQEFSKIEQMPLTLAGQFNKLKSQINDVYIQVGTALSPVILELGNMAIPLIQNLGNSFVALINSLSQSGVLQSLMQTLVVLGDNLINIFASLLPAIQPLLDAITPIINSLVPIITDLFQNIIAPLLPPITEGILKIVNALMPVFSALEQALAPLVPIITDIITMSAEFISQLLVILQPIFDQINELFTQLAPSFKPILEAWSTILMSILEAVKPIVDLVVMVIKFLQESGILDLVTKIATVIGKVMAVAIKGIAEGLKYIVSKIGEFMKLLQPVIKWLTDKFTEAFGGVEKQVDKVADKLDVKPLEITSLPAAQISRNIANEPRSALSNTNSLQYTAPAFQRTVNNTNSTLSTANKNLSDFNSIQEKFIKSLGDFWNAIVDTMKTVQDEAYNRLKNTVKGVTASDSRLTEWNGSMGDLRAFSYQRLMSTKEGQRLYNDTQKNYYELQQAEMQRNQVNLQTQMANSLNQLVGYAQQNGGGAW